MSISYEYFGVDTLTSILVGDGRGAWRRWSLMDHEGPMFDLQYLGYGKSKVVYLPPAMLATLYDRFKSANPGGVDLHSDCSEGEAIALKRFREEELDLLFDQRKVLLSINGEPLAGYPHMRPYLPELFERETMELLASDPWLDAGLLRHAERLGAAGGGIPPDLWVDRSSRWSPEWRAYCDRLAYPRSWIRRLMPYLQKKAGKRPEQS